MVYLVSTIHLPLHHQRGMMSMQDLQSMVLIFQYDLYGNILQVNLSELCIKQSTIRHKGSCFCNITHQSTLQRGKVVSIMFPTFSFIFQPINKSVCLIHFPSCFGSSILKLLFFIHLIIIFLHKSCLQLIKFIKFSLCFCKLFKCNSLTSFLDLEEFELWFGKFMIDYDSQT